VEDRTYAVQVENVTKRIKGTTVLQNVSLQIPHGSICGVTGPNGSGKSMLLRVVTGLVLVTHGAVRVFGKVLGSTVEFAPSTGALIDIPGFLPRYSGMENLKLLASIRDEIGDQEIVEALIRVGLDPKDKRHFHTYSTGMRQRLGIAQAIMEKPQLIILDEPTRGIDEQGHGQIYELIHQLHRDGVTILLTSHYDHELRNLCNTVYRMQSGQLSLQHEISV
jgi:ABC-2 type transport system ATP-binding protein